jgi:hypothetical protein
MQNKCKIEENINFYEELEKPDDDEDTMNENICLISGEELQNYYVQLQCGHKFNYIPLYKDLFHYKTNMNNKYNYSKNEIRCPYCRKKDGLLPYYPELKLSKIYGINAYKDKTMYPSSQVYCQYHIYTNDTAECNKLAAPMIINNETKNVCLCHYKKLIKTEKEEEKKRVKAEKEEEKKRVKAEKEEEKKRLKAIKKEKIKAEKKQCH